MYWSLAIIDPNLIAPAEVFKYYPRWIDYVEHALVLPFALFQVAVESERIPKGKYSGNISKIKYIFFQVSTRFLLLLLYLGSYTLWILHVHSVSGEWPYPIIPENGGAPFFKFVVFPGVSMICLILHFLLKPFCGVLNNSKEKIKKL